MRITTNMIMRNYNTHLSNTMGGLESSRRQAESHRRFQNSYEDPAAAARAAVLDRRHARREDYTNNILNAQKWQDVQEDTVMQLVKQAATVDKDYSVGAMNEPTGYDGRKAYAEGLRGIQETMVQLLNNKYGDSFVMGGNAGIQEAPFQLDSKTNILTYRGVDVSSVNAGDTAKLEQLAGEHSYIDIGFGLSYDAQGDIVTSSVFDMALPGINVVGYGMGKDGLSENMIVLLGQMAHELEQENFDSEAYARLWDKFSAKSEGLENTLTNIGSKTQLLTSTAEKLKLEEVSLQEQVNNEVGIDPAKAITGYSWAMYAYNSTLKIGTSIISPSLLDFLK